MKNGFLKLSILLVLISSALWFSGSWWYYTCKIKNTCSNATAKQEPHTEMPTSTAYTNKDAQKNAQKIITVDTDNDGLSDEEENKIGTDILLSDTDGDSITDDKEVGSNLFNPLDTDKDGVIDALDLDDDNDGLPTLLEEKIGTSSLLADTDGDGLQDIDEVGTNTKQPLDTDNDGIINALDTDDDDDTLETSTELLLGTNPLLADTDGDGLSDSDEIGDLMDQPKDTDTDGTIDALDTNNDLDQDGDGLSDKIEAILNTNPNKSDTDGDGISDAKEVGLNTNKPLDSDMDGIIDALDTIDDTDSDNDGLTNADERKLGSNPSKEDSDNDGINDNEEIGHNINAPLDTDNDGILNLNDADDDNDGLTTAFEIKIGTNPLNKDTDNDGISDKDELGANHNELIDTDKDGKINPVDEDDDGDGILTSLELSIGSDPLIKDSKKELAKDSKKPSDLSQDETPDVIDDSNDKQNITSKKQNDTNITENNILTVEAIVGKISDAFQASRLYFPSQSSDPIMTSDASQYFDKVVKWMNESEGNNIVLVGHTDSTGSKKSNLALGIRRVMVIRKILINKGAPFAQIETISRGELEPLFDNRTKIGRLKNRRVEIAPIE